MRQRRRSVAVGGSVRGHGLDHDTQPTHNPTQPSPPPDWVMTLFHRIMGSPEGSVIELEIHDVYEILDAVSEIGDPSISATDIVMSLIYSGMATVCGRYLSLKTRF